MIKKINKKRIKNKPLKSKKNGFPKEDIPKSNLLTIVKSLNSGSQFIISLLALAELPGAVKEKISPIKLITENTISFKLYFLQFHRYMDTNSVKTKKQTFTCS